MSTEEKKENKFNILLPVLKVTSVVFCILGFLCLVTGDLIFYGIGLELRKFFLALFGYASFPLLIVAIYVGVLSFAGISLRKNKHFYAYLVSFSVLLIIIAMVHIALAPSVQGNGYFEYFGECWQAGLGGFKTCTFGGAFCSLITYPLERFLSTVGSYIILAILLGLSILYFFRNKIQKNTEKPEKESGKTEKREDVAFSRKNGKSKLFCSGEDFDLREDVKNSRNQGREDSDDKHGKYNAVFGSSAYSSSASAAEQKPYSKQYEDDLQSKKDYILRPYTKIDINKNNEDKGISDSVNTRPTRRIEDEIDLSEPKRDIFKPKTRKPEEKRPDFKQSDNNGFSEFFGNSSAASYTPKQKEEVYDIYGEPVDKSKVKDYLNATSNKDAYIPGDYDVYGRKDFERDVNKKDAKSYGGVNDKLFGSTRNKESVIDLSKGKDDYKYTDSLSRNDSAQEREEVKSTYNSYDTKEKEPTYTPFEPKEKEPTYTPFETKQKEPSYSSNDVKQTESETEVSQTKPRFTEKVTSNEKPAAQQPVKAEQKHEEEEENPYDLMPINYKYVYPPVSLLKNYVRDDDLDEIRRFNEEKSNVILDVLWRAKIEAEIVRVLNGPTVTRFDIAIPKTASIKDVTKLSDDLNLWLASAGSMRMIAPIPGTSHIGIEVPNEKRQTVGIREIVTSEGFINAKKTTLTFALGKNLVGDCISLDIAKMPHLLVAGATGTGKSVCLNTMLTSLLMKYGPDELRIMIVDPKIVEFAAFEGIPHLMFNEMITSADKATAMLSWAVKEMESRYQQLYQAKVQNINDYNEKMEKLGQKKMNRILILIDEFADLMSSNKATIEEKIGRLAQKARAAGIHLVLATQRPSVDIMTGSIKTNFTSRISFKMSSATDSMTILTEGGAESLLGNGDCLYRTSQMFATERVQDAFISKGEMDAVIDYIKAHNKCYYNTDALKAINAEANPPAPAESEQGSSSNGNLNDDGSDNLMYEALRYVIENNGVSISRLQRKYRIGFNRAASIVDWMTEKGYISQPLENKTRKILISMEEYNKLMDEMNSNGEA